MWQYLLFGSYLWLLLLVKQTISCLKIITVLCSKFWRTSRVNVLTFYCTVRKSMHFCLIKNCSKALFLTFLRPKNTRKYIFKNFKNQTHLLTGEIKPNIFIHRGLHIHEKECLIFVILFGFWYFRIFKRAFGSIHVFSRKFSHLHMRIYLTHPYFFP